MENVAVIEEKESYEMRNFLESIKTDFTRRNYTYVFNIYLNFLQIKTLFFYLFYFIKKTIFFYSTFLILFHYIKQQQGLTSM